MSYKLLFSREALKDAKKIKKVYLASKCKNLLNVLADDPFSLVPPYEKLIGDLKGFYSRRINIQHRLIYEVDEQKRIVKIHKMWSHYE